MTRELIESIETWQYAACPRPTPEAASKGLGYHLEEVEEMLKAIQLDDAHEHLRRDACTMLDYLSQALKQGQASIAGMNRVEVCDGLADQMVTALGFGYRVGMNIPEALRRVDASNWSKFDQHGKPIHDEHGKVVKGPAYHPVDLRGCY